MRFWKGFDVSRIVQSSKGFKLNWTFTLKFWRCRFDGGLLAADNSTHLRRAFIDRVSTGDEELAEVFATETDIERGFRRRDDEVHTACLIEHLDAEGGGDVQSAFGVNAGSFRRIFIWPVLCPRGDGGVMIQDEKILNVSDPRWLFECVATNSRPGLLAAALHRLLIHRFLTFIHAQA